MLKPKVPHRKKPAVRDYKRALTAKHFLTGRKEVQPAKAAVDQAGSSFQTRKPAVAK